MTKNIFITIGFVLVFLLILYKLFDIGVLNKDGFSNNKEKNMNITSVFANEKNIPAEYTCDGDDISPVLSITDVPTQAKSLVLVVDDPDAPMGTFTHWVLYNLPADTTEISSESLPKGTLQGANDFGRVTYGGPCPPSGVHRYFFKLYALDKILDLQTGGTKAEVLKEIRGHVLEQTELIGLYARK